jgi:protocatechuate 3,4-dioxygenase beta subunit
MSSLKRYTCCTVWIIVMAAFAAVGCVGAWAQETTGSISGTVTDSSGAVVKGATVYLTNTDRGQNVRMLTTNNNGSYTARSLPLGTYTVKVTAPASRRSR